MGLLTQYRSDKVGVYPHQHPSLWSYSGALSSWNSMLRMHPRLACCTYLPTLKRPWPVAASCSWKESGSSIHFGHWHFNCLKRRRLGCQRLGAAIFDFLYFSCSLDAKTHRPHSRRLSYFHSFLDLEETTSEFPFFFTAVCHLLHHYLG